MASITKYQADDYYYFSKKGGARGALLFARESAKRMGNRRHFEEIDGYRINCQRPGGLNFVRDLRD